MAEPLNIQILEEKFPAGYLGADSMILMADGTEKPIGAISVGDVIMTPYKKPTKVMNVSKKSYNGPIRLIKSGDRTLQVPEGGFVLFPVNAYESVYLPAESFVPGNSVVVFRSSDAERPTIRTRVVKSIHKASYTGPIYAILTEAERAFFCHNVAVGDQALVMVMYAEV